MRLLYQYDCVITLSPDWVCGFIYMYVCIYFWERQPCSVIFWLSVFWEKIFVYDTFQERKKHTCLTYQKFITFSVLLELPWKSILLVHYNLYRVWPPKVKKFGICALVFVIYARFILLDKIVLYIYWNLPLNSYYLSHFFVVVYVVLWNLIVFSLIIFLEWFY